MADHAASNPANVPAFRIYRASEAGDFDELGHMEYAGLTPIIAAGLAKAGAAATRDSGNVVKELFSMPGMSLSYAWLKSGFPLPLHTHNSDCVYYIIAGSLKIGTEELNAGDGFFVGRGVPYSYVPGPQGVEVLEFRTQQQFDIQFKGKTETYWDRTAAAIAARQEIWASEAPPHRVGAVATPAN